MKYLRFSLCVQCIVMVESVDNLELPSTRRLLLSNTKMRRIPQFDQEMGEQFAQEDSRVVKVCMLKYKCIIMFTFMIISLLQFIFIMLKEFTHDDDFKLLILSALSNRTSKSSVD